MNNFIGITERGDAALDDGWVGWVYKEKLPAILITKNAPLLQSKHPDILSQNIILHVTCTGLGNTEIEPNVPDPIDIITWLTGVNEIYRKKLVLRIDPIFFGNIWNKYGGARIMSLFDIADQLKIRCRISFLDLYPHVRKRLENVGVHFFYNEMHAPLESRLTFLDRIKALHPSLDIEVCGEPGMPCTGCISEKDLDILGMEKIPNLPEGGPRPGCKCLAIKRELLTHRKQCPHGCLYCYWR